MLSVGVACGYALRAVLDGVASTRHKGQLLCPSRDWFEFVWQHLRPHSSLGNKTPAQARRALEQFEGSAHDALAQTDDEEYEIQTRKLSL